MEPKTCGQFTGTQKASEYDAAATRWARVKEQLIAARNNAQRAAAELEQIEKEEASAWNELEVVAGRSCPAPAPGSIGLNPLTDRFGR